MKKKVVDLEDEERELVFRQTRNKLTFVVEVFSLKRKLLKIYFKIGVIRLRP